MINLQAALYAYLDCALWASNDESDDSGGRPLDESYSTDAFTADAVESAKSDLRKFCAEAEHLLDDVGPGPNSEDIGHNLWLSRNGHGTGFWDRDYTHGDALHAIAEKLGERYVFVTNENELDFE